MFTADQEGEISPLQQYYNPLNTRLRRNGTSHVPYGRMASQERDKYFVNIIHKGLTVPIDKILRKKGSG
jgi:hypothetical protein